MSIRYETDLIMNAADYAEAVSMFGRGVADSMMASSPYSLDADMQIDPTNNAGKSVVNGVNTDSALQGASKDLFKSNNLIGENPWLSMKGAFGDANTTGWIVPAANAVNAVSKTVLGYKELEATKEHNKELLARMDEANFMKKLKMKNQVNQANRYAMLGMGNSNSQSATLSAVNRTPYTSMNIG